MLAAPFVCNLAVSVLTQKMSLVPYLVQTLSFSQKEFLVYQIISKLRVEVCPCSDSVPSYRQIYGIKERASKGYHNSPAR